MASRSAPYATTNDYSTPSKSVGGKSPSSIAPWDKDQSPKMQSKGGDARKALINSPKLAAAQTAPYSTASNYQEIIPQSVEIKSVSEYAPFGTAENVPIERFDRFQTAKLTAFGTLEEPKKSEEVVVCTYFPPEIFTTN